MIVIIIVTERNTNVNKINVTVFKDTNDDDDDDDSEERKSFALLQLLLAITNITNRITLEVDGYSDNW